MSFAAKWGEVCKVCKLRKGGVSATSVAEGGRRSQCTCDTKKETTKSSKCFYCRVDVEEGVFACDDCLKATTEPKRQRRRRPMTEWEEMKSGFYKSDKKWEDNIKSRQVVNGVTMYKGRGGQLVPLPTAQKRDDGNYR